jgi:hypothetical protein
VSVHPEIIEEFMNLRHVVLMCAGVYLLAACSDSAGPINHLVSCGANATQLSLSVGQYALTNSVTDSGCVSFPANTSSDSAEYVVLPWSAGGTLGATAPFALQSATPVVAAAPFNTAPYSLMPQRRPAAARGPIANAFDHYLRELARTRAYAIPPRVEKSSPAAAPQAAAAPPTVGDKRTFRVCSNMTCATFDTVGAVARTVGAHIAIYVDTLAPSPGVRQATLDSIASVFDSRLYPLDTATFGGVSDIDNNSVVIVLMTGTVNQLVKTADCAQGFIAGFFFAGDIDPTFAPQFNNGEIFYSVVADSAGTLSCAHSVSQVERFMPVTFVHEFQHMINFVQHVRVRGGNSEDTWLDEGLARYAEENAGRSFLASGDSAAFSQYAIDPIFDAYMYLSNPLGSPLLIAADTGGLAPLGAGWLFVRYIVDQFGDSLPHRLVGSALTGQNNVATQTGQSFDVTSSRWGFANWVDNLPNFTSPPELQYTSWNFRHTFDTLFVQDPRDFPRPYPLVPTIAGSNAVNLSGTLRAGSGGYVRVMQAPNSGAFSLRLSGPGGALISANVIPRLNVLRIR